MRQNTISRSGGRRGWAARSALAAAVVAAAAGAYLGYAKLREAWTGQCVVTDVSRQVVVRTGSNIRRELILEKFGLKNGANLALVDFAQRRREILAAIPNIRSLTVSRILPDRVEIDVAERDPVARMNERGGKPVTGRVVDAEGVVFMRQDAGTALLPMVVEPLPPTKPGCALKGRSRAALRLLLACREPEWSELKVLAVSTAHQDYLTATLGNYTRAKFAWEGMDEPKSGKDEALRSQLRALRDAKRSPAGQSVKVWNVTEPGMAFGDTKEPIL